MVPKKSRREGKTCDANAKQGIDIAAAKGIETAWDRYDKMQPQCTFGELGVCCDHCLQGPCRLNPFKGTPDKGICGARDYTIVARNLIRHIAGGAAAHSGHGRHIAETMVKVLDGKARAYSIKDVEKLRRVARRLGIDPTSKTTEELAKQVVKEALEDFGRFSPTPLRFTTSTISPKRKEALESFGLLPNNIVTTHIISLTKP